MVKGGRRSLRSGSLKRGRNRPYLYSRLNNLKSEFFINIIIEITDIPRLRGTILFKKSPKNGKMVNKGQKILFFSFGFYTDLPKLT